MFDEMIKVKFQLFSDPVKIGADLSKLKSLQKAVLEEMARFLTENNAEKIEQVSHGNLRLRERIDYFLSTILVEAKEIHGKRDSE